MNTQRMFLTLACVGVLAALALSGNRGKAVPPYEPYETVTHFVLRGNSPDEARYLNIPQGRRLLVESIAIVSSSDNAMMDAGGVIFTIANGHATHGYFGLEMNRMSGAPGLTFATHQVHFFIDSGETFAAIVRRPNMGNTCTCDITVAGQMVP